MSKFFKHFGGKVTKDLVSRYQESDNWHNGTFKNFEETSVGGGLRDLPRIIYRQLTNRKGREPKQNLPIIPFDKKTFLEESDQAEIIWYGHSVVLLRIGGKTILIDPMLGSNTTPIAPFPTKRFSTNTLDFIDDFPEIDLILMTHDHYDHLDLASITKLKDKTKAFYTALGVKRHLTKWGVNEGIITEFDWWDTEIFGDLNITFTPSRHFSGRGISDRDKALWGGWVIKSKNENIWFSGDGGYGKHFKEIGERLGPFDFAFMECGQYNSDWHLIHMFPEEAIKAAIDGKAKRVMPVHWAGFALSYHHTWKEPAEDFVRFAEDLNQAYTLPRMGEIFQLNQEIKEKWWDEYT